MTTFFHTPESIKVFEDPRLPEPKSVWNYFLALVETPRGSGHLDLCREKLVQFGKDLGLETIKDEFDNVMIRKPASPGYESHPSVCLQAHYDIVAVANEGLPINFLKDPLKPQLVPSPDKKHGETALMATGTSLGADNGIGCAMILAILADKNLKHGPIEGLFTSDEETTMYGASNMKPGMIKSPYLINVDSEENWRITIGCAGGFEDVIELPLTKGMVDGVPVRIELKGLQGGHSGVEIHEERGNALKLLGQLVHETLFAIKAHDKVALQYFVGGDKRNVIPPAARCSVVVPAEKKDEFLAELKKQEEKLKAEWKTKEAGMTFIETVGENGNHKSYDIPSSRKYLDTVMIAPHGIIRWSPDVKGLVESSINFCKTVLCDKEDCFKARFEFFPRSSDNGYMPVIHQQLTALSRLIGGIITDMPGFFPGWLPDPTNPLLHHAEAIYKELFGHEAEIYAVHAGLECGMFQQSHPGLKCISVGPYMTGVHSPKETLFIDTVPKSYRLLTEVLARLE